MVNDEGVIEMSDILVERFCIRIKKVPLKDYKRTICKIDRRRERARIELAINGNIHFLDVGVNILE